MSDLDFKRTANFDSFLKEIGISGDSYDTKTEAINDGSKKIYTFKEGQQPIIKTDDGKLIQLTGYENAGQKRKTSHFGTTQTYRRRTLNYVDLTTGEKGKISKRTRA